MAVPLARWHDGVTARRPSCSQVVGFMAAYLVVERETYAVPLPKWLLARPKAVHVFLSSIITDPSYASRLGVVAEECAPAR